MKNINVKKLLPHVIAIVVFLLVTVIFCKPALEPGVVMQQSDVTQSNGMTQQSKQYRQEHGVYPVWTVSMFGGMPAYNTIFEGAYSPLLTVDKAFQLFLPKPLNFFFLSFKIHSSHKKACRIPTSIPVLSPKKSFRHPVVSSCVI